jgi:hypothetical protein
VGAKVSRVIECSADRRRLSPEDRPAEGRAQISVRFSAGGPALYVHEGAICTELRLRPRQADELGAELVATAGQYGQEVPSA